MLAAKAALACRFDALCEESSSDLGLEHRAKVEARIRMLEGGHQYKVGRIKESLLNLSKIRFLTLVH